MKVFRDGYGGMGMGRSCAGKDAAMERCEGLGDALCVSIHVMVAHSTDHVSDYVSKPDDEGNE
jgi:hypothetical protein